MRFAGVGVLNTLTDITLFMLLNGQLGIVVANIVSTSAGMVLSFVANGLFTFGAGRLTLRQAMLFAATNALTLWVMQPVVIHALVAGGLGILAAKVAAVGCSIAVNFAAYRWVVWPVALGEPQSA